ncbi:MAG: DUF2064 domain-containing protein [Chitinophagaceae bacterium]
MGKTCILIFSRFANEESAKKKYARVFGNKNGVALASELIHFTLQEAKASGLPVIPFFSDKQEGNSFGERFANALEHAFSLGFEKIIACGTDSPSISSTQFSNVAYLLKNTEMVLAPALDGGVILTGISANAYQRESILKIPWQTDQVFDSLKKYAEKISASLVIESSGEDIDEAASFLGWRKDHSKSWLTILINSLLIDRLQKVFIASTDKICTAYLSGNISHRGPPAIV